MTLNNIIDQFLENEASTEEEWILKENQKRKQFLKLIIIISVSLLLGITLIVCDVLFFKSIIVSIISGIATVLGILINIIISINKLKGEL